MDLVAFLGNDKENWGQITALINKIKECDKIVLVKDKETKEFPSNEKCIIIEIDSKRSLTEIKKEIHDKIKRELSEDFEVALSIVSGSGKEHMALISALLSIPVGVRFVAYTKEGIEFFN
ncbi:MAG: hypothetical protein AABX73_00425 [Nanoarchaeota archaeon]